MKTLKPPLLKRGDVIGVIAPASAPNPADKIDRGVRYLESLGYRVELGAHVRDVRGYLAGGDAHRADDFNTMVRDPRVRAIFAVRGGYGTPRILDLIDYTALKRNPKIIVGYSDLTAMQLAIFKRTGLITFSGPMVAVEMQDSIDPFTEDIFWRTLTSARAIGALPVPGDAPLRIRFPGTHRGGVSGLLLGGNLSLLTSIAGSRFLPSFVGSLLLLEEVEEEPYRIDRMLAQLRHASILTRTNGVVLGAFTDCTPHNPSNPTLTLNEIFSDYLESLGKPVVENLAYGHIPRKLTLPIGAAARIVTRHRTSLDILEPVISR